MINNMEKEIFDIYIDDIIPNRFQPRLTFDQKSLGELADSIRKHGIIQPLVVRKVEDKYEIIAGERRYKAAQIAGLTKVPAVIMNLDDNESAEVAVIENIQRRDLSALEEAESYKKLLDRGYLTQEQLATRMGKTQATVSNKLRLLGLDSTVKEALLNEKISERHARSLLSLKNVEEQKEALNKIIDNKLTVKQTDELIKSMQGEPEIVETLDFAKETNNLPPTPMAPIADIQMPSMQELLPIEESIINTENEPIEEVKTDFEPISNIDINKMKEEATDINPVEEIADVNALLGLNGVISEEKKESVEEQQPRFITSLEDEETNMDMQENKTAQTESGPITPMPDDKVSLASEPKTYTDSLVQEFRHSNGIIAEPNRLIPGDIRSAINKLRETTSFLEKNNFKLAVEEFDFENIYQIIIKINK
ncbi:MAG: ParB/RepB/Spo0J family partition protein [Bacilli bacterium]|jgi:ParB family chromosome partitioning protein